MSEFIIKLTKKENSGNVELFVNGKLLNGIKNFNMNFDGKDVKFEGSRLLTDRSGQFYVDEKGETASENVDLLSFLNDNFFNAEIVRSYQKAIDWDLHNIYMTSMVNAYNFIKEEGINIENA